MEFGEKDILSDEERQALFLTDHELTDETEDSYYDRKRRGIESGEPTWWVYNFDSHGRVYSFWLGGSELAMVIDDSDDSEGGYSVLVRNPVGATGGDITLHDDSTMLLNATTLIEAIDASERHWL